MKGKFGIQIKKVYTRVKTSFSFGFMENIIDQSIWLKVNESKFKFVILYVIHILHASKDINLFKKTKVFLFEDFDIKDLNEAFFMIKIKINSSG